MPKTSQKPRKPRSAVNRDYNRKKKTELEDLRDKVRNYEQRIAQLVGQVHLLTQQKLDLEEEKRSLQRIIDIGTGPTLHGGINPRAIMDSIHTPVANELSLPMIPMYSLPGSYDNYLSRR
ncbi:8244_t:CDS:2 [Cetraspora pellucida]|uniref:8244_t:CDS:1 n=1 Tax=Cetraspora pellucida TaxID=1433469 RepID=A0A9N9JZS1_9GLOM|nr:8244_t:CDS:2 [Cetraspora pellucida]